MRALPRARQTAILSLGDLTCRAALGRGGMNRVKREGDGATPVGCLTLEWCALRADRRPAMPRPALPTIALSWDDGWCDAPESRRYNRPVRLPFRASAEKMWRGDHLYDVVIGLSWNTAPARRGLGSAIFFHLARPGLTPTEGCVAVPRAMMRLLLPRLRPGCKMLLLPPGDSGPKLRRPKGKRR
ncbi:L,D-transpeptidase family protein [Afifella pfennigii]|uniref:L,D-transpeptidase family protein n=1 Tax=Afifella pfennigii TaxID=209897 RepID=UPI00068B86E6|nr:L,D-transpeptidase family protein [Afifella pfennigii]